MVVDFNTKTYDVYITPPGDSEVALAQDYAFRSDAPETNDLGKMILRGTDGTYNQFRVNDVYINGVLVGTTEGPRAVLSDPVYTDGQYKLIYGLRGAVGVKAQYIIVSYDKTLFDFVSAVPVSVSGTTIAENSIVNNTEQGTVSFIMANLVQGNAINGDIDILEMVFRSKTGGTGTIALTSVQLANSAGVENIYAEITGAAKTIDIPYDREPLETAIQAAHGIFESAVEGIQTGQYPAGTKDRLEAAINAAEMVFNDENATGSQILQAIADLNEAVEKFTSLVITDETGDYNTTPGIGLGDLAIIADNYGKTSVTEGPGWEEIKRYDINGDGEVGLYEFAFITMRMTIGSNQ